MDLTQLKFFLKRKKLKVDPSRRSGPPCKAVEILSPRLTGCRGLEGGGDDVNVLNATKTGTT